MSKPALLVMDNVSDRREMWHLLHRMPPRDRVRFLKWACGQVGGPGVRTRPEPTYERSLIDLAYRDDSADLRVTNLVYYDVWVLVGQWEADPIKLGIELDRRVKAITSPR